MNLAFGDGGGFVTNDIKIYNDEFGVYKHAWEQERDGEYKTPMTMDSPMAMHD